MKTSNLSLCMIVRNEEHWLASCLKSVVDLVDDMIVLDTGSTDGTIAIARSFDAQVHSMPWEDDFSKARNKSIDLAQGDWILVLDADEVVRREDHEKIKNLIKNPEASLYWMTQTTYIDESATFGWIANDLKVAEASGYPGYVNSPLVRLFRRSPDLRFHGVVHEHLSPTNPAMKPLESGIRIHHYGKYSPSKVNDIKDNLYLKLGLKKCRDNPQDAHSFYELGVQYWGMREFEKAREALFKAESLAPRYVFPNIALAAIAMEEQNHTEALRRYMKVLELDPTRVEPYFSMPAILIELKRFSLAEEILAIGERYVATHPTFHINKGIVKQVVGNHRGAVSCFREAIRLNVRESLAYYNCGVSHVQLGEWDQAEHMLAEAMKFPAMRLRAVKKLADSYFRSRKYEEAIKLLGEELQKSTQENELRAQLAIVLIRINKYEAAKKILAEIQSYQSMDQLALERLLQCNRIVENNSQIEKITRLLNHKSPLEAEKGVSYDVTQIA